MVAGSYFRNRGLWAVALDGGVSVPLPLPGYNPSYPAISAKGNRLVFVDSSEDLDIWRVDGPAFANSRSAARAQRTNTVDFLYTDGHQSTVFAGRQSDCVHLIPDRIVEIWVCDSDGSNPVQLTDFNAGRRYASLVSRWPLSRLRFD